MVGQRRRGGTPAFLLILVITACTLATWRAFSIQTARAGSEDALTYERQASNAAAKSDRLVASAAAAPAFELASLESKPVTLAERPRTVPKIETAPKAEVASEKPVTAFAPVPAPPAEKPKRALAPPASTGQFDESQIPGFKSRLRLTPEQAEYWPAIEAALRDVLRHLAREARKHGGTPRIDVHSAEVQRLVSAAMPLLMSMREDQKREVRQLARVIGLEQVAAAI